MRFLSISTGDKYPFDKHLTDGLRENGHEVFELFEKTNEYRSFIRRFKKLPFSYDMIIVGYSLPLLVPIVRFFSKKRIIFNAVASQYEANIVSRNYGGSWSSTAWKSRIIDFLSFHLATYVLLESAAQIKFIQKLYFVPQKKLIRSWSGLDEEIFFFDPSIQKKSCFTVLFRGKFLPESGILTVIETAKLLEEKGVEFVVIGHGFLYREVNALMERLHPKNLAILSETLPPKEMRDIMLSSHISLGQLAIHPRLSRTIPCKLFESLALRLPYLSGRNAGVLELLQEGKTCFAVDPGNAKDLAEKILFLKDHPEMLQKVSENGYELYRERLTSKKLSEEVMKKIFG